MLASITSKELTPYIWQKNLNLAVESVSAVASGIIFVICVALITIICARKNMQPLKKKSAYLVICSVIGHFLVILNVSVNCIYFHMLKSKEGECYFEDKHYDSNTYTLGDDCIKEWYQ